MKLFLSPHNDDETLFGALTLLRERPHVVVCLRSFIQEQRGTGITYQQREAETAAAMDVLGCTWEQWDIRDDKPDWAEVRYRLGGLRPEHVWAPCPEINGHDHHNMVGELALRQQDWECEVTRYLTYTRTGGKSVGNPVPYTPAMIELKLRAMACYRSQILEPSCTEHFVRDLREYVAA